MCFSFICFPNIEIQRNCSSIKLSETKWEWMILIVLLLVFLALANMPFRLTVWVLL